MGMRDEMFRAKVLIFMIPLVLPIGQPPAQAINPEPREIQCSPWVEDAPNLGLGRYTVQDEPVVE